VSELVRYGDWINDAWKLFTEQWPGWIALSSIILVSSLLVLVGLFGGIAMIFAMAGGGLGKIPVGAVIAVGAVGMVLAMCLVTLIPPMIGGIYIAAFNQMRTGHLNVGDIWQGFKFYKEMNLYFGVVVGLIMIGAMCCIVPGIYLATCAMFGMPLIVEKKMGYWEAFNKSREMVSRDFWNFLLYSILTNLVSSIGGYICYVFMVVTYPFFFLMTGVAFRDTFGVDGVATGQSRQIVATGFCRTCGAGVVPGQAFCMNCGQKIV
jgi:hypothetical protein